jgi:kynurenine/2-aminoadipate aminotransferase
LILWVEINSDGEGLNPESLQNALENWPAEKTFPKVLYTVPIGGNPTGSSTTLDRKKRIYALAQKFNLIILEDDPYYYLQFDEKIPSYFSMDVDGRVLRFDSLSKILSAGARLGWVSGPKALIDRIVLHGMVNIFWCI